MKKLESSEKMVQYECSMRLAFLEALQVGLSAENLTNEELIAESLKEVKQTLGSRVSPLDALLRDIATEAFVL